MNYQRKFLRKLVFKIKDESHEWGLVKAMVENIQSDGIDWPSAAFLLRTEMDDEFLEDIKAEEIWPLNVTSSLSPSPSPCPSLYFFSLSVGKLCVLAA